MRDDVNYADVGHRADLNRDVNRGIELQVLHVFRVFTGLYLALATALLVLYSLLVSDVPPTRLISLTVTALLFAYLLADPLRRWLKRLYLPLALAVVTIMPIIEQYIVFWWQQIVAPDTLPGNALTHALLRSDGSILRGDGSGIAGGWYPLLFMPLVIIAWRYGGNAVTIFCAATAGFDASLYLLVLGNDDRAGLFAFISVFISRTTAFIVVGYVVTRLTEAERRHRERLHELNRQLIHQAATREMLAASRERNRLARELHDTLAHTLSAASVQLEASMTLWETQPDKARSLVSRTLETTRTGLTETRRALESLRASPLDDLGLLLALRQLAEASAERAGWRLELTLPATMVLVESSAALEQTLYRCAQEALSNIDHHAGARVVCLALSELSDSIHLLVQDDGCGFTPDAVLDEQVRNNGHYGLVGIQERLKTHNGVLHINSRPGAGTTLTMIVPLTPGATPSMIPGLES